MAKISTNQRKTLSTIIKGVTGHGSKGIRADAGTLDARTVQALIDRDLVTIEERVGYDRFVPTPAGREVLGA
jgi:hypothetical protein